MNINILTMLGALIAAAAFITKHLIDKSGHIPEWAYIIAYVAAIVLLASGMILSLRNRM